jgi:hypothetical protein
MVFFFTCISDPSIVIYMGKDKFENEDLIKYAWPQRDIWFHVAELSSAHVYLRVPEGVTNIKDIPAEIVQECAQLTKANSIEGCKRDHVGINYTWARNLKKTAGMDTGAVSFHKPKDVMFIKIEVDKQIVKTISKTKEERYPDLKKELEEEIASISAAEREKERALINAQKEEAKKNQMAEKEKADFFNS